MSEEHEPEEHGPKEHEPKEHGPKKHEPEGHVLEVQHGEYGQGYGGCGGLWAQS